MIVERVEGHFRARDLRIDGITVNFGRRGNAAFVRLSSPVEPGRWAMVASPGTRWFAVEVAGGFSLNHFDEDLDDDEVRAVLDDLLEVAVGYLLNGGTRTTSGCLRLPALVVSTSGGERVLRRSLVADVKALIGLKAKV